MADLYDELQIYPSATTAEITAAYRRLALIYHPDKNPEDVVTATEKFVKLTHAYEILSDANKRQVYDVARARGIHDPFDDNGDEDWVPDLANTTVANDRHFDIDEYIARLFCQIFERTGPPQEAQGAATSRARPEERKREQERRHEIFRRQQREELERQERENLEKELLRQKQEAARQAEIDNSRQKSLNQEAQKQQARWQRVGAITKEEKALTCLHSQFCEKTHQKKKTKCDSCGKKRSIIAFECPHCSRHLCQLCVDESAKARERDEYPNPFKQRPEAAKASSSEGNEKSNGSANNDLKFRGEKRTLPSQSDPSTRSGPNTDRPKSTLVEIYQPAKKGESQKTRAAPYAQDEKPESNLRKAEKVSKVESQENSQIQFGNKSAGHNMKSKQCYACGKPGHIAVHCRQTRQKNDARKVCFNCGKPGHFAATCRQPRSVQKEKVDDDGHHTTDQDKTRVQDRDKAGGGESGKQAQK